MFPFFQEQTSSKNSVLTLNENHNETENNCDACESDFSTVTMNHSHWKRQRLVIILAAIFLFVLGLGFEFLLVQRQLSVISFILSLGIAGFSIAKTGIKGLVLQKRLNISFLMTIAAVASFIIGHPAEGAAVMVLYYIAEFLERLAKEDAQRSVASLMKLAPEVAMVKRGETEECLHVHEVLVNETVVVRPGEKIPLDGIVIKGTSSINQSPITGESLPVLKAVSDEVYAGTINNEGFLEIQVTHLSNETMLSKILTMVEQAQKLKSPTELFIDRFAKYYTPSIVILAVLVGIIPPLLFSVSWLDWVYRALVLLVISCPCAFAISTPVSMVSALTSATRNGVLIKGSRYIEELGRVKVVAFDKTGTLTEGKLVVTEIIPFEESEEKVLQIASSLESFSEHPISKAIMMRALNPGLRLFEIDDFTALPGQGVSGFIEGAQFFVGSERLFTRLAIPYPKDRVRQLEREGKTIILVGKKERALGAIAVQDTIRSTGIRMVEELRKMGVRPVMLTGDNENTAKAIAKQLGIEEFHAELLPQDKVNIIKVLQQKYGSVAMVGDGINDAPALAIADIGIAMGAIGSDAAIETADIALMHDDLTKLPYLFQLSRTTKNIVHQNVLASLLVKFSLALLVFPGLITLWIGVAVGDMGLSLAVILNAMRLSRIRI